SGVDQPRISVVRPHLPGEFTCVYDRVKQQKCRPEACREGGHGFLDPSFRTCHLRGITAEEVILRLLLSQPGDRGQYPESICCEKNDGGRMPGPGDRSHNIVYMVYGVGDPRVFRLGCTGEVDLA